VWFSFQINQFTIKLGSYKQGCVFEIDASFALFILQPLIGAMLGWKLIRGEKSIKKTGDRK
jgi:hypothetical protein